jgi:hypothetical protein
MRVVFVLLTLALIGCSGSPTQPDRIPAGRPFQLGVGQTAVMTDGLRVRFDSVRSDSRCPMDALCIRAGEAVIAVTLSLPGEAPIGRELQTVPALSHTTYSRFTITLSQLQPYPRSDRQIQVNDYIGTFSVTTPPR